MIKVNVRFFTTLREITGAREMTVEVEEGTTVEEFLDILRKDFGKDFEEYVYEKDGKTLSTGLQYLVDGRNIFTIAGQKTKLSQNAVLAIIPPIEGGHVV